MTLLILSVFFRITSLTSVHMISVQLSKTYGPVFTVYFGLKKVIVIAGYRTVKQALVNHAEEFGNREVTPIFYDFTKGHGKKILFELVTLFIFSFSSCLKVSFICFQEYCFPMVTHGRK